MRKLSLTMLAMFFRLLSMQAQEDSTYKQRKLHVDEVNFVAGYYNQDGNNSAVTGGIGTEKLTDLVNSVEVKLIRTDKKGRQHDIAIEAGFDHYSSASSDKIDASTISSASSADGRFYPSLAYNVSNKKKDVIAGGILSYSIESDYQSYGIGANITKVSKDRSRELTVKMQAYLDYLFMIYAIELRYYYGDGNQKSRNSYSLPISLSQVINQRLQVALMAEPQYQHGVLATTFQRVYLNTGSERPETLPESRAKLAVGARASWFWLDRSVIRLLYRFYADDWGITGHTASAEIPVKITPLLSIGPVYRYAVQNGTKYFAPYRGHAGTEQYFTSDYDLSSFDSHFFGANIRFTPVKGILGITHFSMLELRYGHYIRSTGLYSDVISLNARFR